MRQPGVGRHRVQPAAATVVPRHHRRHLRDQAGGLGEVGVHGVRILVGIVERVRRHGRSQHLHRLGVIGQHVHHRGGLGRQLAGVGQGRRERLRARPRWADARAESGSTPLRRWNAPRGRRRRTRRRSERRSDRRSSTGGCAQPPHLRVHLCLPCATLRRVLECSCDFDPILAFVQESPGQPPSTLWEF